MKWNRNVWLAVLLIGIGVLILLGRLGLPVGNVTEIIIPLAMVGLGWYGIKHGRSTIGWIVLIIGLIALLGALSGLLALIFPIVLILIGWSLLKNRTKVY
jgi:lia operon protein LiaI